MAPEVRAWVEEASVALAWFAAVPNAEQAARLLEAGPGTLLLAPDLVLVDLLNGAWKSLRLGAIQRRTVPDAREPCVGTLPSPVPLFGALGSRR